MKKRNAKIEQKGVMTAIVGSYPKAKYLFDRSGRELLDTTGMLFYEQEKKIGTKRFRQLVVRASLMAIRDQNAAGIDFMTDGEERRGHYVLHILKGLKGIDFQRTKKKYIRSRSYIRNLPIVV